MHGQLFCVARVGGSPAQSGREELGVARPSPCTGSLHIFFRALTDVAACLLQLAQERHIDRHGSHLWETYLSSQQ